MMKSSKSGKIGLRGGFDEMEDSEREIRIDYGNTYYKWCKKINDIFSRDKDKEEEKEKKRRLKKLSNELDEVKQDYTEAKINYDKGEKELKKARKEYERKKKKIEKKIDKIEQTDFHEAIRFLGWDLEINEVMTFAGFISFIGLIGVGVSFLLLGLLGLGFSMIIMFTPALVLVPVILYVFTANYPELLANRVKVKSIGRSPECINYMIMSMSLNPALDQAVKFTSEHIDEPLSTGFRRMIWGVMLRKFSNIEEAIINFAIRWGEWNENLRQSIYVIKSSTLEKTELEIKEDLDKAYDIILNGTKSMMEDFASSLSGPTMILFALGVLLPLVIGALLPMLSLQLPNASAMSSRTGEAAQQASSQATSSSNLPLIVLFMNIVFPASAAIYSYYILGKRPGTSKPPKVQSKLSKTEKRIYLLISIVGGVLISLLSFPPLTQYFIIDPGSSIPLLLGITFAISFYLLSTTRYQKKRKDEIEKIEKEFPNALFQLGNRIAEGKPLELAIEDVMEGLKGSKITTLLNDIAYRLKMTRSPLSQVLFNENTGVLNEYPSRTIHATMKTVVKASKKDNVTAGKLIADVSSYLRDLQKIEDEIKNSLESAVGMMRSTALFFGPIVMGITTGLYSLLYGQFKRMPYEVTMISPSIFSIIIGVYLFLMTIIIVYFSIGILEGEDRIEMKYSIGISLPVALGIYSIVSLLSQNFIGV